MPREIAAICAILSLMAAARAQQITVDVALDDVADFSGGQTVADLPGPDGHISIREAVMAANNTPGPQTIAFAIPISEWSIFFTDRAIIRIENMLYVSGDDTTIDFSTQTAFTGDTNPAGNEVGLQYAGVPAAIPSLWIAANGCTVRGLDIGFGNNFSNTLWVTGSHNRVVGCTTNGLTIRGDYGGGAFNTIGGASPGDGNVFSEGVNILSHANDNVVIGNVIKWGLRINGDTYWGTCDRNRVGGPTPAERNTLSNHGYYSEEGLPTGAQLEVYHASDTLIQGNYVGTTTDGSAKSPGYSGTTGIGVGIGAVDTTIRDNLVSGILMIGSNHYQGQRFGVGIAVVASAVNTAIIGNGIGLAADGVTPIPNREGVVVNSDPNGVPNNVLLGGAAPGDVNVVAGNETNGVRVSNSAVGVRISRNSIRDNSLLGIDLTGFGGSGVTPNDPLDTDTGGNKLQNYPVLTSATVSGGSTRVSGTLNSAAGQSYTLEFFANPACDPSGYGEGAAYLGSVVVNADAAGYAAFEAVFPVRVAAGGAVTATATDAGGNTSEFSACVSATATWNVGDMNCNGTVNTFDIQGFVTALTGAAGYAQAYPDCVYTNADVNGDGTVNPFDIQPFIDLLLP